VPSAFSHSIAALSIGSIWYRPRIPKRLWVAGAVCSALPDVDVIGFRYGVHYSDFLGHRGFTHSFVFAALLALTVGVTLFRRSTPDISRTALVLYLFVATASHGVLDAMTDGGLGVAFFSPFDTSRYFLPWRPIHVAPISPTRFFTMRGWLILQNEIIWIWIPAVVVAALVWAVRQGGRRSDARLS
jgi:inner membrane protein